MFASVTSVALVGVEARPVRVEVRIGGVKEGFGLVGLPDTAIREAKERVRSAITYSGFSFPHSRVTVNLSPADLPKAGSAYDLPIALAILAASGAIPQASADVVALGELALDGTVRTVRGAIGAAMLGRDKELPCVVPHGSMRDAALVNGARIRPAADLRSAADPDAASAPLPPVDIVDEEAIADMADVRGQLAARRAFEVAAAGGHHILLIGPPGAGKTMLARRLPGILPALGDDERLEVAQAWGAAGHNAPLGGGPPFRSPHHSASRAAIIGGGSAIAVPGELTLAHRGVLFLDELGEFPRHLLDSLRQPVEEGAVVVARKGISVRFPCAIQLVAATNPCPCGFLNDRVTSCRCTPAAIDRYRRRLSGPLLDRFDLRVSLERNDAASLAGPPAESSERIRNRVVAARERQARRDVLNRDLQRTAIDAIDWSSSAMRLLAAAVDRLEITGRGWDRVRRVAVTIADLDVSDVVEEHHVAEALGLRG